MTQTKVELAQLRDAASGQAPLRHFFDKLIAHHEALPLEQHSSFLKRLKAWDVETKQKIFYHAVLTDHDKALQFFINNHMFTLNSKAAVRRDKLIFETNYFKHLSATYLKLASPLKTQVYKALALPNLPDVLKSMVMEYALPWGAREDYGQESLEAMPALEEKPVEPVLIIGEMPENVEDTLNREAERKNKKAWKLKYFFSLFMAFLCSLLALTLVIGTLALLLMGTVVISPFAVQVFVVCLISLFLLVGSIFALMGLINPLVILNEVVRGFNTWETSVKNDEKVNHAFLLMTLFGLALVCAVAFTIGVIAILPPLGLTIPLLAWVVVSGAGMVGSVTALGLFKFKQRKEEAASVQFKELIDDCAKEEKVVSEEKDEEPRQALASV